MTAAPKSWPVPCAGMEVIYLGLHQTAENIVNAAIQEDANVIGLSSLAGAHMTHFPRVIDLLKEKNADDIMVFGGGIIPEEDRDISIGKGVRALFGPGTDTEFIVEQVRAMVTAGV